MGPVEAHQEVRSIALTQLRDGPSCFPAQSVEPMVLWEIGQSVNRLQLRGQTLGPIDQIRSNRSTGSSSE
eukprot:68213-Alexandrium_andersonii.AAC.1